MHVDEKRRVVGELAERIRAADSMIVADYRGLTVTQIADVRGALREVGASFHVAKNTLARRAARLPSPITARPATSTPGRRP